MQPLMSECSLATKVSTPLSKNVQIVPKGSILCVATIIFQHCLNPLGHWVHQSFTGWPPEPSSTPPWWHQLADVKDLALLHLMFEDAPQILETCSVSPLPLPSASSARQWSSWRCVWGHYHVGILPCGPVSEGRGIMLRFSMSQYMLAFMVPSMSCSSQVPAALMQPQTMTLPPPCLTVGKTHSWLMVNWTFSLRGVLTFVASGLDINGCVLRGQQIYSYTSCTLTTLHCSKV